MRCVPFTVTKDYLARLILGEIPISKSNHNVCAEDLSVHMPYAHGPNGPDGHGDWESYELHIQRVAVLAKEFGEVFECSELMSVLANWHDLGKLSNAWQDYLQKAVIAQDDSDADFVGKVDHSTFGAQYAYQNLPQPLGRIAAYCIAGHHGGLLDAGDEFNRDVKGNLVNRLHKQVEPVEVPIELTTVPSIPKPPLNLIPPCPAFQVAFWTRMLFSCLVDADFLATELHYNQDQSNTRKIDKPHWKLWASRIEKLISEKRDRSTLVGRCRDDVYQQCLTAASKAPGFFSLTVPTGGGKTYSSCAFAMAHAHVHKMSRVIFALPFTSIIEQNVEVIRDVLEDDVVLEHHSNLNPKKPENQTQWSRLAAENWDAPVVVTTNIQFFESLFASSTSRCRKLHNLANSIIVLDEAQKIPVDFLTPCLRVLNELVLNYGCTIVLCTATQPAINHQDDFEIGLKNVQEIIANPEQIFEDMNRVKVQCIGKVTIEELAERMAQHEQVLTIVDTRKRAADLYNALSDQEHVFHLSAAMCPAHRCVCLDQIRELLKQGEPCRVVSTQLIEAGVDVDFPAVYRSLAGLDSIAQAAGRCNREGKLDSGDVFVFEPENGIKGIPPGFLRQAAECTREILPDCEQDLLNQSAIKQYFDLLYWKQKEKWDSKQVMACFKDINKMLFDFKTASRKFELISTNQKPVVVNYGSEAEALIKQMVEYKPTREVYRKIQRYTVQIPIWQWDALVASGDLELVHDNLAILQNSLMYDNKMGLVTQDWQASGEAMVM